MIKKKTYLSKQKTIKLINEVQQRPCLWNPNAEEYNGRYPAAKAWAQISLTMDLPDTYLKSKWRNLRDTFKKELHKYPDEYKGSWQYFDHLSFVVLNTGDNDNNDTKNIHKNKDTDEQEQSDDMDNDESEDEAPLVKKCEPKKTELLKAWVEIEPGPEKRKKYNDDHFDVLFLKSLTPYFKQLDPIRKLVVRSSMQDMLLKEIAAQNSSKDSKY